jgi:GalNAc-alpha-(1->4)-GalNAc-alpha-(1->3)-diNAcBac-PP-undecaprenol alpha-1,4-N-acetyl-D-galactosaminyltransferase
MKVLFIIGLLSRAGGAERVLCTMSNYWAQKNHKITILSVLTETEPFYSLNSEVTIKNLAQPKPGRSLIKNIKTGLNTILKIRAAIKTNKPDITISFMTKWNLLTILAGIKLQNKLIISERTHKGFAGFFLNLSRRMLYPFANAIVLLSKSDYDNYCYLKNKKIIFNPLYEIPAVNETENKEKIILAVGQLTRQKAFDVFIRALSLIKPELLADWKVLVIGHGSEKEKLHSISKELGLTEKINFLEPQKDIGDFYRKAAIFVSTSTLEGFPNALSEALSFGCACVATDCLTGPSELISNNENGLLVEVNNIEKIKEQIELLLTNENIRKSISKKAAESAKRFELNKIMNEWEAYVEDVAKNKT